MYLPQRYQKYKFYVGRSSSDMPTPKKRNLLVGSIFTFKFKSVKDNDPKTDVPLASATVSIKSGRDDIFNTAVITDQTVTISGSNNEFFSYQIVATGSQKVTDVARHCIAIWKLVTSSPSDTIIKKTYFDVMDDWDER